MIALGCVHGRREGQMCPWCAGVNGPQDTYALQLVVGDRIEFRAPSSDRWIGRRGTIVDADVSRGLFEVEVDDSGGEHVTSQSFAMKLVEGDDER